MTLADVLSLCFGNVTQQLYNNPAFDMRVKPYMRLASDEDIVPEQVVTLGSDVKIVFTVDLPDDLKLADIDFSGKVLNTMQKDDEVTFEKTDCIPIEDGKISAEGNRADTRHRLPERLQERSCEY